MTSVKNGPDPEARLSAAPLAGCEVEPWMLQRFTCSSSAQATYAYQYCVSPTTL